jgi:hypothetical protein
MRNVEVTTLAAVKGQALPMAEPDARYAELERESKRLKAEWKSLESVVEEARTRIGQAIDAGDVAALRTAKQELSELRLNVPMAELAYQRSLIPVHEVDVQRAKVRKAAALEEMVRLGYENGFPQGKKAAQVAKDTYELSVIPSKNATVPILSRIEDLKAALAD